jgi:hypothetical protein
VDEGQDNPNLSPTPLNRIDSMDGQITKRLFLQGSINLVTLVPIRSASVHIYMAIPFSRHTSEHLGEGGIPKGTRTEVRLVKITYKDNAFHS